jgi:hypothetical protein
VAAGLEPQLRRKPKLRSKIDHPARRPLFQCAITGRALAGSPHAIRQLSHKIPEGLRGTMYIGVLRSVPDRCQSGVLMRKVVCLSIFR